jgi:UDP:flavonoid glycosyltransferase YjiC (YdhE family)
MLGIPRMTILNQFQVVIPRRRRFLRLAKLADAGTLTIVGKIWSLSDRVLIPDFPDPFTISWNQRIPPQYSGNIRLIGPILTTYPSQLPSKEDLRRKLGFDDRPLIFAPISGPILEKAYFEGILQRALKRFPRDYKILMTLGNPGFKKNVVTQGDFSVYHWVKNRFEFLKACDLIICRGGHGSITQSIAYGKPMIIVPTPNHSEQAANSRRAEAMGVAKIVDQKELDSSTLLRATEEILGRSSYRQRASAIKAQLKDTNAVSEIVKETRRLAEANR